MIWFVWNMIQADKHNELAEKRNVKAFEKISLAELEVTKQSEKTEMAIEKLINRKIGILKTTMESFLEIYKKIILIDFVESDEIKELFSNSLVSAVPQIGMEKVKIVGCEFSTAQTIGAVVFQGGVSGFIKEEAKQNANLAAMRNRQADLVKSQAETICVALESIEMRANKISDVLAKLNVVFKKSLDTTSELIERNGKERRLYSKDDKEKIMTCINAATTIKKIIDTPILDANGKIAQKALDVVKAGSDSLAEINRRILAGV